MKFNLSIFAKITLVSIFLVVLAGGVVRMTGSGMGCPDWPKCFDCYIPPTDISQLPDNYKDIYSEKRKGKIERFGKFLTSLGFDKQAQELVEDKRLLKEQDFSAFNTWTEYINRLFGALAGLLIFIQTIALFAKFKKRKLLSLLAFALLILTGFQAWFGAMVVATNIVPWVLSIHMMLAIVMIMIQIAIIAKLNPAERIKVSLSFYIISIVAILLLALQTVWGTSVRQQIDVISETTQREFWMDNVKGIYYFHRSLAIGFLLIGAAIFYLSRKEKILITNSYWIAGIILTEAVIGKLFSVLGMPAILQPTHLLLSMVLFAFFSYNLIRIKR